MPRVQEDVVANEEIARRMTATEILESERRRKADNHWGFLKLLGPQDLATLAGTLDYRQKLTDHFARVADMSYKDARALAKVVTHAAVYRVPPKRLKEIMMDSCTITLDAGDRYMMKQMKMTEAEYEQFIFDILLEKYNLYQPIPPGTYTGRLESKSPELPLIGKHYDRIILDDIQEREENVVNQQAAQAAIGRNPAHAAPYPGQNLGQALGQASITPVSIMDQHRNKLMALYENMRGAEKRMYDSRATVFKTDPLHSEFTNLLSDYHATVTYYLACVHDYLDVASVSLGVSSSV